MSPNKVGAQRPIKIPCNSSPVKKRYSEISIIIAHKLSTKTLVIPNFLMNFICSLNIR